MKAIDHRPEVAAAQKAAQDYFDENTEYWAGEWKAAKGEIAEFFSGLATLISCIFTLVVVVGIIKLIWSIL